LGKGKNASDWHGWPLGVLSSHFCQFEKHFCFFSMTWEKAKMLQIGMAGLLEQYKAILGHLESIFAFSQ